LCAFTLTERLIINHPDVQELTSQFNLQFEGDYFLLGVSKNARNSRTAREIEIQSALASD
jgi:hypothetical protein